MIFEILFLLIALVFFLIYLGYNFNAPYIAISGFTILFLIGAMFLSSGFLVKTGEITTNNPICSYCIDSVNRTNTSYSFGNYTSAFIGSTITSYIYTDIDNVDVVPGVHFSHILGLILSIIGVFGYIDVFINIKGLKELKR